MHDEESKTRPGLGWHHNNSRNNSRSALPVALDADNDASSQQFAEFEGVPPAAHPFGEREQSAEEVMEASLSFRQQSLSSNSRWLGSSGELYPHPSIIETDVADNQNVIAVQDPAATVVHDEPHHTSSLVMQTTAAEAEQATVFVEAATFTNNDAVVEVATVSVEAFNSDVAAPVVAFASFDNYHTVGIDDSNTLDLAAADPAVAFASLDNHHTFQIDHPIAVDDEADLIALKRATAGYSHGACISTWTDADNVAVTTSLDQEALVVGISEQDVHPSDISGEDARAEFIGQDYSRSPELLNSPFIAFDPLSNSYESYLQSYQATPAGGVVLGSSSQRNDNARVAWSSPYTEEAYVLDDSAADSLERKRPAMENGTQDPWGRNHRQDAGIVVAEEEAEVVGITEDVHPSEMVGESVAEFVGSSFNVAMAEGVEHSSGQATVVGVSDVNDLGDGVVEEGCLASSFIESGYSSAVVLPLISGTPLHQEQQPISEAHVLPSYTTPSNDNFCKSPPMPRDTLTQPIADQNGRDRPSAITFTDIPEVQRPSQPDNFVIISSGDYEALSRGPALSHLTEEAVEATPFPQRTATVSWQRDVSAASTADSSNMSRARSDGSGSQRSSLQTLSSNLARSTNTVIEKLFGETPPGCKRRDFNDGDDGGNIHSRTLLPWSVFRNEATGMWVVTLNTNQKALDSNNVAEASKALKAFTVPTEKQAMALARSWAPPKMLAFQDNPSCVTCDTRFAVFRRACHCRNCGVCICSRCVVQWPSKMIPETYNIKRESIVNICKACDWLCTGFRLALLEGDFDHAVAMHSTGNINLVTPFANVKGELFYPVHCAVLGGSLELLKWLVDENCCPLRSIRISGKNRDPSHSFTPILTSRGRSLLSISMEMKNVPIIRYLVVEKGMSISAERNVTVDTITQTLMLVLQLLPHATNEHTPNVSEVPTANGFSNVQVVTMHSSHHDDSALPPESANSEPAPQPSSPIPPPGVSAQHLEAIYGRGSSDDEASGDDMCIICFSNRIDCVVTPCGHQICCLQCSKNISRCPVCSVDCSFMRVFKA